MAFECCATRYGAILNCAGWTDLGTLGVPAAMVALDDAHFLCVQQNNSIDTSTNTGFAKNALVMVEEDHLGYWISPHGIYRTHLNTRSLLTRPTDIRYVNAQVIVSKYLEPC